MFKKSIAAITAALLSICLGSVASAASATDPVLTAVQVMPNYIFSETLSYIKEINTVIWEEAGDNNTVSLKSAKLNADGTFRSTHTLVSQSNSMPSPMQQAPYAVSKNGVVAVLFSDVEYTQSGEVAHLMLTLTDDGENWSSPIEPLPSYSGNGICGFMFESCGYFTNSLAFDDTGRLAIVSAKGSEMDRADIVATSSADGLIWTQPSTIDTDIRGLGWTFSRDNIALTGLPSGFIVNYNRFVSPSSELRSSRMPDGQHPYWLPAETIATGSNARYTLSTRTPSGGALVTWHDYVGEVPTLFTKTWNAQTKAWGDTSTLLSCTCGTIERVVQSHSKGNYNVMTWVENTNQADDVVKMAEIKDGVVGTPFKILQTPGTQSGNSRVFASVVAADGTASVLIYDWTTSTAQIVHVKAGIAAPVQPIPKTQAYVYSSDMAIDDLGNITAVLNNQGNNQTDLSVVRINRATAPIPAGAPKVVGVAKAKAKLKALAPIFSSISGVGATTFQWYQCTKASKKLTKALPAGCKAISGAKASTYLAGTKDKKKFLLVAVKNVNALGAVVLYSPTTGAVK